MKNKKVLSIVLSIASVIFVGLSFVLGVFMSEKKKPVIEHQLPQAETGAQNADVSEKGGAIFLEPNTTYTFTGGTISGSESSYGGAVYVSSGAKFIMTGGTIESGSALYGGAIYVADGGQVEISGGTINSCVATNNGGGIYVEQGGKLQITGGELSENVATSGGGAIYTLGEWSVSNNAKITGNQVQNGNGGGIYSVYQGEVNLSNMEISSNTATGNGGGIYIRNATSATIAGGTITGNTASIYGGGLWVGTTNNFTLNGITLTNNTASSGGGGVSVDVETNVTLTETENNKLLISNNASTDRGAGINVSVNSVLNINAGEISNNNGYGVYLYSSTINFAGGEVKYNTGHGIFVQNGTINFENNAKITGNKNCGINTYGSTVYLKGGTISGNDSSSLCSGVNIYGGSTCELTGTTISENLKCGIRASGENTSVTVTGGSITNNKVQGVIIEDHASLTMSAGLIDNNSGAGIWSKNSSTVSISGGNISNNTSSGNAGGIYAESSSTVTITGGDISNNTSSGSGAGIYVDGATLTFSGGTISSNTADIYGGGIYAINSATVTISGGSVSKNSASTGSVYAKANSSISLTDGRITENTSKYGVYLEESSFTMSGGLLDKNTENGIYASKSTVNISGGTISNHTSTKLNGGGIYAINSSSVSMSGGLIESNTTTGNGGGIYLESSNASITGGEINLNTATGDGGGIYVNSSSELTSFSGSVVDSVGYSALVSNNKAQNGGGIYLPANSNTTIYGSVYKNTATNCGGGIYAGENSTITLTEQAPYYGATISSNTATSYGGGLYLSSESTLNAEHGAMINGNSAVRGGGFYGDVLTANLKIANISSNKATEFGGGIYMVGSQNSRDLSKLNINGANLSSNSSNNLGGAIYTLNVTINLTAGTIGGSANNCNTANNGGALFVTSTVFNITGGEISYNKATYGGGGVYIGPGTTNFSGGLITQNTAKTGGGFYVGQGSVESGVLNIKENGRLEVNTATNGGGIYSIGVINLTGGNISSNTATNGAGLYVDGGTTKLEGSEVSLNNAVSDGGGVYINKGTASLSGALISTNTAVNGGGVFVGPSGIAELNGSTISKNYATNGGGMYFAGQSVNKKNTTLSKNYATEKGGGMYIKVSNQEFRYLTITENYISATSGTYYGGGVYVIGESGALCIIYDSTISSNYAPCGGGIDVSGCRLTLNNTDMVSNYALNTDGGAIFAHAGTTVTLMNGSILEGNNVKTLNNKDGYGGAITSVNGTINVQYAILKGNYITSSNKDGYGGAIYGCDGASINITDVNAIFENNYVNASQSVGGNVFVDKASTVNMSNGTMACYWSEGVQADVGGGIASVGYCNITGGKFSGLRANYGAAIGSIGFKTSILGKEYDYPGVISITGNASFYNCKSVQLNDAVATGKNITLGDNVNFNKCNLALGSTKITKFTSTYTYSTIDIISKLQNPVNIVFCEAEIAALSGDYGMTSTTTTMEERYVQTSNAIGASTTGVNLDHNQLTYNKDEYIVYSKDNQLYIDTKLNKKIIIETRSVTDGVYSSIKIKEVGVAAGNSLMFYDAADYYSSDGAKDGLVLINNSGEEMLLQANYGNRFTYSVTATVTKTDGTSEDISLYEAYVIPEDCFVITVVIYKRTDQTLTITWFETYEKTISVDSFDSIYAGSDVLELQSSAADTTELLNWTNYTIGIVELTITYYNGSKETKHIYGTEYVDDITYNWFKISYVMKSVEASINLVPKNYELRIYDHNTSLTKRLQIPYGSILRQENVLDGSLNLLANDEIVYTLTNSQRNFGNYHYLAFDESINNGKQVEFTGETNFVIYWMASIEVVESTYSGREGSPYVEYGGDGKTTVYGCNEDTIIITVTRKTYSTYSLLVTNSYNSNSMEQEYSLLGSHGSWYIYGISESGSQVMLVYEYLDIGETYTITLTMREVANDYVTLAILRQQSSG